MNKRFLYFFLILGIHFCGSQNLAVLKYNSVFSFPNGLPKIHEHDGLAPKALGYFHEGKLVLLFTFESDLGDGWEDANVHNDPEVVRLKALKMGANIIKYAFEN